MAQSVQAVPLAQRRSDFFDKAVLRSQILPRQAYSAGGTIQFNLPHAGFGAFMLVDFQGTLTITGSGGSIALSDKAPYNLFDKVNFEDYLGITRISVDGFALHQRLLRMKWAWDENNSVLTQPYSSTRFAYSIGSGSGAAGSYPWNFSVLVPIALHEGTTEGSFPFTLPNGDNTLSLTFASLVGSNNDSVIKQSTAGFTVTLTGTVGVTYYYWDVPSGIALPVEDFSLVHELRKVRVTSGITAGTDVRYTLRTGRTYYQIIENLRLNDTPDTADVTEIAFYVDGNTPTLDETLTAYLNRMYMKYGRDFVPGEFVWDFWNKPWTPNDYGSLETSLTLASSANVSGNSYLSVFTESMYRTSKILADLATLPGGQQA